MRSCRRIGNTDPNSMLKMNSHKKKKTIKAERSSTESVLKKRLRKKDKKIIIIISNIIGSVPAISYGMKNCNFRLFRLKSTKRIRNE